MHVCMQLRQPTLWINNPLVLAVRYIAVTNVNKILFIGFGDNVIEVDRSLKFSSHYWVHQVPG